VSFIPFSPLGSTSIVRASRRRAAVAVSLCAATVLTGCSSTHQRKAATGSPGTGPAQVALTYASALFSGEFEVASHQVDLAGRGAFLALTAGLGASSIRSHDLAVGSSAVAGTAAIVILTGTICSSGSMATLPAAQQQSSGAGCVSNTDPHSASPIFRVDLASEGGQWLVTFRMPSSAPDGTSPAITSTQAPATP
jgi:hypothetical protein